MSEEFESTAVAEVAAGLPEAAQESATEELTDAQGGTENVAEQEGDGQQKQEQKQPTDVERERQKFERAQRKMTQRYNELTAQSYADRAAREAAEKHARDILEMVKSGGKPATANADGKPNQSDFTDYAEFVRADATWHAKQAAKELIASERAAMAETTHQVHQHSQSLRAAPTCQTWFQWHQRTRRHGSIQPVFETESSTSN